MSKTAKRKSIYRETYKSDTEFSNKAEIVELINQPNVTLIAINGGRNNDDSEYVTLRIEGIDFEKTTKGRTKSK